MATLYRDRRLFAAGLGLSIFAVRELSLAFHWWANSDPRLFAGIEVFLLYCLGHTGVCLYTF